MLVLICVRTQPIWKLLQENMQGLPSTSHMDRLSNLLNSYLSFQKGAGTSNSCRNSGLALIRWSLEELSTREPRNALLLMEQVLMKLQEMGESDCYNTFVVLTLLFWFALVHMPHIHGNNDVLQRAYCHFRKFLSLPNPMGHVCRDILSLIKAERRAPGITYQRIVRMENMNHDDSLSNKTILLLDPADLSPGMEQAVSDGVTTRSPPQEVLIGQAFQSIFGTQFNVPMLREKLKNLSKEQLKSIYERCTDAMEEAAATPHRGKSLVKLKQQCHEIAAEVSNSFEQERASDAELENVPDFIPHFEVRIWKEDHLDFLNTHLLNSDAQEANLTCSKEPSLFPAAHHGPPNTGSSQHLEPSCDAALLHEQVLGTEAENADQILPKQPLVVDEEEHVATLNRQSPRLNRKAAMRRRPGCNLRNFLRSPSESYGDKALARPHSCCCEQTCMHLHGLHPHPGPQQLHIVLFGMDRTLGRLAGAYCKLRTLQAQNQKMSRHWHLQFYYIPVQSDTKVDDFCEIGKYLSTLDPWYEGIISRFDSLVSAQSMTQQSGQAASTPQLWANTLLYYCRNARCPIPLQLHQVTMTSLDEDKQKIFIQEMELVFNQDDSGGYGNLHPEGAGNPVPLDITYHKVSLSGRLQHHHNMKQCTALKLTRTLSDNTSEPGGEWLYLTLTEIIKLTSGKPRVITTKIRVQEIDFKSSSTFAVCLDKDRENVISNITRCVVSPYRLPHVRSDNTWSMDSAPLCIAINTFSGSLG
uniref:phosphoinositide 3-kinase regulatory subunit 5-like n=1 Tax=Myxine glutinosa TaxID=7769 RepID=UPI00358E5F2C